MQAEDVFQSVFCQASCGQAKIPAGHSFFGVDLHYCEKHIDRPHRKQYSYTKYVTTSEEAVEQYADPGSADTALIRDFAIELSSLTETQRQAWNSGSVKD